MGMDLNAADPQSEGQEDSRQENEGDCVPGSWNSGHS
jgi:hypothetical protein